MIFFNDAFKFTKNTDDFLKISKIAIFYSTDRWTGHATITLNVTLQLYKVLYECNESPSRPRNIVTESISIIHSEGHCQHHCFTTCHNQYSGIPSPRKFPCSL